MNFCLLRDFHIFRRKQVIDHQSRVHGLGDGRAAPVALLKVAGKFPQAQGRLEIAFASADAPQGLLIELRFLSHKGGLGHDGRRDPIADVLQGHRLQLGPFLLRGDRRCARRGFDLVAFETDVADGAEHLDAVDLPPELLRFHVDRREDAPGGGWGREGIGQPLYLGIGHGKTGKIPPHFDDDLFQINFHLHNLFALLRFTDRAVK